uniref:DNA-directed RNA polymerase n=1 Tax=Panagrolaimus sp. ES5 TaxID=591445 RepID=A0AC34FWS7_9BILA
MERSAVPNFGNYEIPTNFFETQENVDFDYVDTNFNFQQIAEFGGVLDKEWQQVLVTSYAIKENISDAGIDRLGSLFKAFIGDQFLISKSDVIRQKKLWLSPFDIQEKLLCLKCKNGVPNMQKSCRCGADRSERVIITTASITPHLLHILEKNEQEFFRQRQITNKRGDLSDYMPVQNDTNELILELLINTDGVVAKSNSRRPFHPIFIMIKNLCGAKRSAIKNLLLAGIISGVKTPDKQFFELALDRLYFELQHLKEGIIYTSKSGQQFRVKAVVTDAILDQIEAKIVYDLASHMSYGFACTICETFPTREDNAQRWPLSSGQLRTTPYGTGLPTNDTAFARIAPSSMYRLDGLHVLDEGLCKSLLYYLKNNFKIMDTVQIEINRALMKNGNNCFTYAKTLKGLNAHELRLFFTISVPLLTIAQPLDTKVQSSFLFWHLCRLLYSKHLNVEIINDIAPVFELLGRAFEDAFGSLFKTIKGHRFFGHGGEELKKHGTPADFSAAPCESGNRHLKILFTPYNTRGFDRSLLQR